MKKKTEEEFVEQAKVKHGDRYDYSNVHYVNSDTKVKIICSKHGIFEQLPTGHLYLRGRGCPSCGGTTLKSLEKFVNDARTHHGSRYDYSLVNYINSSTKVKIICSKHGIFEQSPNTHLRPSGCQQCHGNGLKSTEKFINESKILHGDRYDYSEVLYTDSQTKVNIICPDHGGFLQKPNNHLNQRSGCPTCKLKVSKIGNLWLDECGVLVREKSFLFNNEFRMRQVDGYDTETNTIYQFHGTYWHGHPDKFKPYDIHHKIKRPYGKIYEDTLKRDKNIIDSGYNLVLCWEHEWKLMKKEHRKNAKRTSLTIIAETD
jgi:hypothetical protein